MRLAYVDPHCVPDPCTESLQILQTVDALGEIGMHVDLVTPKPRRTIAPADILGRPLSANVALHHLPDVRKRWWFPSSTHRPFYWLARRTLRQISVDAILVRNLRMAEVLLKDFTGSPVFFEAHEVFAQTFREEHPRPTSAQRRKLATLERRERFVYSRVAGVAALTPLLLEDLRKAYSVKSPGTVAPDGVDLVLANATPPVRSDAPVLLYLGSLHPWKGVEVLILAMKEISGAVVHVAGGEERRVEELRRLARREGVDDRVRFLGPIPPVRRFDVIGRADICLLPSTATSIGSRYTSPMKLFEYMAMGKAIVAADLPSIRCVLTDGKTGLLCAAGNSSAFASAIGRLLREPGFRERLGVAARERVRDFTWVARAREIVRLVETAGKQRA